MTAVDALKRWVCFIRNDGTTPDQLTETNVTALYILLGDAFNERFNGVSSALGELTLVSSPSTQIGTTAIQVTGANSGAIFKYKETHTLPKPNEDLSTWKTWDGTSPITIPDGTTICIVEVDSMGKAMKAGSIIVNSKW